MVLETIRTMSEEVLSKLSFSKLVFMKLSQEVDIMMVDDYYQNIFGAPVRKKREDQMKKPHKSERSMKVLSKQESVNKEMNGSTRRPKEESNDDTTEVKIEIGKGSVEFDLKEEECEAVKPKEGQSSRRGSIAEDVGISLGDIGDDLEPESAKEDVGEERRIYPDNGVAEEVDGESKITTRSSDTQQMGEVDDEDPSTASKTEEVEESFERKSMVGNSTTEEETEIVKDEALRENREKQKDEQEKPDDKMEEHSEHGCEVCGEKFDNKPSLNQHNITQHGAEKIHKCGKCGKLYSKKSSLTTHKIKHEIEDGTISSEKLERLEKKKIHCEECGKLFYHQSQHIRHMKGHKGIKEFQCDQCDKSYTSNTSLAQHIEVIHLGKRSFVCSGCGKTFGRVAGLKIHSLSHSKELV